MFNAAVISAPCLFPKKSEIEGNRSITDPYLLITEIVLNQAVGIAGLCLMITFVNKLTFVKMIVKSSRGLGKIIYRNDIQFVSL